MKSYRLILPFLVAFTWLLGCSETETNAVSEATSNTTETTTSTETETEAETTTSFTGWPSNGWEESTPEEQNLDSTILENMRTYAFAEGRNTQSVLIIRNGVLVAEWYAEGVTQETLATSWSVAKSFLSAVVGIAIEQGYIPSIDEPIGTYIPAFAEGEFSAITLRHALQMRSGLNPHAEDNFIYVQADQLAHSIDRTVKEAPGGGWVYQNEDSMLVSRAVEVAVGKPFIQYAKEVLFDPIGMTGEWWTDYMGNALGYCCIDATPREFAKFGLLFLRGGLWQEENIVPAGWIGESTVPTKLEWPYGLHWWSFDGGRAFAALGAANQSIWVYPEIDTIVLRNGFYTRHGTSASLSYDNYHETQEPSDWNDQTFMTPLFQALQ